MADPTYGSPEAQQKAVDEACTALSRAEVDIEKAMISTGKLPDMLKEFRTYIAKHVVMMGNAIPTGVYPTIESVESFYAMIGPAVLQLGEAERCVRTLHLQMECLRAACGLPVPAPSALGGGGGGKG